MPQKNDLCALRVPSAASALISPSSAGCHPPRRGLSYAAGHSKYESKHTRMVATDRVSAIFADASAMQAEALRLLASGDIRDAAEKAWCATKRATDALILARTGTEPEQSPDTSRGLVRLAREDGAVSPLIGRYYSPDRATCTATCFYLGECEPVRRGRTPHPRDDRLPK